MKNIAPDTWQFQVNLPTPSQVIVGPECVTQPEYWPATDTPQAAMVFIDKAVHQIFPQLGSQIQTALTARGWQPRLRPVEASEHLKAFEAVYPLYGELLEAGLRRQSLVVAVGGGTVGDAIGFLAATYLRGLNWVNVPTTLLAQVDSSLGGKTGVNHSQGKNLVGAVHQPQTLLCDPQLLGDLPHRDRVSGLGEMLKYGLIASEAFWEQLCAQKTAILAGDAALTEAIARRLEIKAGYVEQDEQDIKGIRAALNFGHTFAHGIEAAAGYGQIRHGEAVLMGMYLAILLSMEEKILPHLRGENWLKTLQSVSALDILEFVAGLDQQKMLKAMSRDKKNETAQTRILCIQDYGQLLPRDFSESRLQSFLKTALNP